MGARWAVVAALALFALGLGAPSALADHFEVANLEALLPPAGGNPGTLSAGRDNCADGAPSCPDRVVGRMTARWRTLDRTCDHRALFALTYLRTTEEFVRTIKADPKFFEDTPWVRHEDVIFGDLYFRAYDNWRFGRGGVPRAWQVAFAANASPDLTGLGDVLLGVNAHINRDLPYVLAHVGLVGPRGGTRKTDHDRVNAFLDRVIDPVQDELARRYDDIFAAGDLKPTPFDEIGALQAIRGFREGAWRNAERLIGARSAEERQQVSESIESGAEAMARSIVATNTIPGYGAIRDAHCRAARRS